MMSYTSQSSDQWLKYKPPLAESGVEDEDTTTKLRGRNMLSPENSCTYHGDHMNMKDSIKKPIRRRSRASKKTPMVLLNANATNFRALVQQYTGCHSSPSSYKGPINLSFGGGSEELNDVSAADQSVSMFGCTNDFGHKGKADHQEHQQQQQFEDHQESIFHGSLSTNVNPANHATSDDIDNNFFNDLSWDYSSNILEDDDCHF